MKHFLNFILAFFLVASSTYGQFNAEFEAFLEGTITFLEEEVAPTGFSISVRSGDQVWNRTIGISSIEDSLSLTTKFPMASITKTFVSAGILKLMEENQLTLNDPLCQYLPSFDNIDSTITIRELLNHTSGVYDLTRHPEYLDVVFEEQYEFYTFSPEEVIELFVLEKVFERGTSQAYSNTNYILLGMIITEIAGRPFYEEIADLFNLSEQYPSISFPPVTSEISELAHLWYDVGNGIENITELGLGFDGLLSTAGAAGGFASTPSDLSQWGYDLYSGELLSESSMDSLFDYHPFLLDGVQQYGLGVFNITMDCGVNAVGHGGNLFYESDLAYSEELDLAVAVMTNDEISFIDIGRLPAVTEEIFCAYKESLVTNSKDIINEAEVTIFPNPVNDVLNIDLPASFGPLVQIDVYNEIGIRVYAQKLQHNNQATFEIASFEQLPDGMYLVRVFDGKNTVTKRVINL